MSSLPEFSVPAPLSELPSPALLVEVERMDQNITAMAARYAARGISQRPHVKTSKCWPVAERQLAAGAAGFTCSTPAEVAWLQDHGLGERIVAGGGPRAGTSTDLLWAHHPVGPRKIDFAVAAVGRGGLILTLDSPETAAPLAAALDAAGLVAPFVLEVNTGQARAGVDPEYAVTRAAEISRHRGLRLCGVMTHEGQLSGYGTDRAGLETAGRAAGALVAEVAGELARAGHGVELVSVGSTPGATSTPFAEGVTEARPGTYVYYDVNQVRLGSTTLENCALSVLARVVSTQRPERVIIDAGSKAMSSDAAGSGMGLVCDPDLRPLDGITFAEANEEHGFLTGPETGRLRVGDLLRIVPNHACGTTNMWSQVYATSGSGAVENWPISARH